MSFWGYALESAACILNMVPTKKTSLITQEASGSTVDFDEIQRQDVQPSENTSQHQYKVKHDVVDPQTDVIHIRRSTRIPQAPEQYGFYIDAEEHKFGDHVDLPHNCKTFGSKWLFKKKTDMDGNIRTYKARLVAKVFIQTYGVDYEETFSPVADIKAIRILMAIAAYYDYEVWQMDVKTTFLSGRLNEDVYMVQTERFIILSILDDYASFKDLSIDLSKGAGTRDLMRRSKNNNLADPLTKPMPYVKHVEHARSIGLRPAGSFM
nr:putative retrotransposon Ty1-copia subclass protein [Tanacetum cinerariifolium]